MIINNYDTHVYIYIYIHIYTYVYIYIYVYMYVCIYIFIHTFIYTNMFSLSLYIYTHYATYVYMCIYIYTHVYIYIYICITTIYDIDNCITIIYDIDSHIICLYDNCNNWNLTSKEHFSTQQKVGTYQKFVRDKADRSTAWIDSVKQSTYTIITCTVHYIELCVCIYIYT